MIIETHDPEETFEVGRKIGMNAKPGQLEKPYLHRAWQQVLESQNL